MLPFLVFLYNSRVLLEECFGGLELSRGTEFGNVTLTPSWLAEFLMIYFKEFFRLRGEFSVRRKFSLSTLVLTRVCRWLWMRKVPP